MRDKPEKYLNLVNARKACALCQGLENPSRFADGQFDSNEIGVVSGWQGGLDALVMIVGQDWGDVPSFERQRGVDNASRTIKTLCSLLKLAGLQAELPSGRTHRGDLFMTNSILCLKPAHDNDKRSAVQDPLRPEWVANCGRNFLRPQIEIIQPKLVICHGEWSYKAVLGAYDIPYRINAGQFPGAVNRPEPLVLPGGTEVVAVYHCGRHYRKNGPRPREKQQEDWQRIGEIVRRLRGKE